MFPYINILFFILGARVDTEAVSATNLNIIDADPTTCDILTTSSFPLSYRRMFFPSINSTANTSQIEINIEGFFLSCEEAFLSVLERVPIKGHGTHLYRTSMLKSCQMTFSTIKNQNASACSFTCQCESLCTPIFRWQTGRFLYHHSEMAICHVQIKIF